MVHVFQIRKNSALNRDYWTFRKPTHHVTQKNWKLTRKVHFVYIQSWMSVILCFFWIFQSQLNTVTEKHFFFQFRDSCPFACGYLPKIMVKSLLTNSRGLQGLDNQNWRYLKTRPKKVHFTIWRKKFIMKLKKNFLFFQAYDLCLFASGNLPKIMVKSLWSIPGDFRE